MCVPIHLKPRFKEFIDECQKLVHRKFPRWELDWRVINNRIVIWVHYNKQKTIWAVVDRDGNVSRPTHQGRPMRGGLCGNIFRDRTSAFCDWGGPFPTLHWREKCAKLKQLQH